MANIVFAGFTGDRSGSMASMGNSPADGLYNWIKDQSDQANKNSQTVKLFVSTFDTENTVCFDNKSIDDIKVDDELKRNCEVWMAPRGMTKLYDSAIADLTRLMAAKKDFEDNMPPMLREIDPKIVMVWACLTDGFDNSSLSSVRMFRQKVKEAKATGVKCFFLAANQDAIATGEQYGFDPACSMTMGSDNVTSANALRCLSQVTREVTSGSIDFTGFTSMMRQSSAPPAPASFSTNVSQMNIPTVQAFPCPPTIQRQRASLRQGAL